MMFIVGFFALLFPSLCFAQTPSVSGVSGTLLNGQTITITGDNFGTTGPTVQFFDDMELGSNGSHIGDAIENAQIGTWRNVSSGVIDFPTYSSNAAHSGSLSQRTNWNEAQDCGSANVWSAPSLTASSRFYISFWMFIPSGQVVPGETSCGPSPNYKYYWLSTNDVFQNDYVGASGSNPFGSDMYPVAPLDGSQNRAGVGYISMPFQHGRWGRFEVNIVGSTSSGSVQAWYTDSANTRYSLGSDNGRTLDDGTTGWGYLHIPGYGRKDSNSNTYMDDIYVSTGTGAQARVEIGNNATYTSCTNLAVQTPTSWSANSITATMRAGSFGTSGTAWLFVVNSNGTVSSGHEITLGSGGGDTTAPTVTITTTDPSSITSDSLSISGTASDAVGVSSCKWRIGSAPDGSNGTALTGTTSWSGTASGFTRGANTLYVGCRDAAGNWGYDTLIVNFSVLNPVTGLTIK